MINFNGSLLENDEQPASNRGLLYGDGVFETVKILDGKVLFCEDHYFRLMASMRIVRMEIPMHFTMEYFEEQLIATAVANSCADSARARLTVYRDAEGLYLPSRNSVSYLVSCEPLATAVYALNAVDYEVDLYKDFYITAQLLSSVKTTNKMINVTGSIFASENGLQNCLLLNDHKNVIEALNGNLFMVTGNELRTPPVADGCINGVLRKQLLALAAKIEGIQVVEASISPFELQKADELFITNVIAGISSVTKYRKKEYNAQIAAMLLDRLNAQIRLG